MRNTWRAAIGGAGVGRRGLRYGCVGEERETDGRSGSGEKKQRWESKGNAWMENGK